MLIHSPLLSSSAIWGTNIFEIWDAIALTRKPHGHLLATELEDSERRGYPPRYAKNHLVCVLLIGDVSICGKSVGVDSRVTHSEVRCCKVANDGYRPVVADNELVRISLWAENAIVEGLVHNGVLPTLQRESACWCACVLRFCEHRIHHDCHQENQDIDWAPCCCACPHRCNFDYTQIQQTLTEQVSLPRVQLFFKSSKLRLKLPKAEDYLKSPISEVSTRQANQRCEKSCTWWCIDEMTRSIKAHIYMRENCQRLRSAAGIWPFTTIWHDSRYGKAYSSNLAQPACTQRIDL